MRFHAGSLRASPTDLANFLVCRHKTVLDLAVAKGQLPEPEEETDQLAAVLRKRGEEHEHSYVERLRADGFSIEDLRAVDRAEREERAVKAMAAGVDVIVQAPLSSDGWFGYADVLKRVEEPSALGRWSYEAHDTKLSRETKGGTILQLCVYSDLIEEVQGTEPDYFRVVTPTQVQTHRFDDVSAYYRLVKNQFLQFVASPPADTYPEPVSHCEVCRWWKRCNGQRRNDDHLSFVSGLGRAQSKELETRGVQTMAALAQEAVPLTWGPSRGAKETYEKLREQARLQVKQRESGTPEYELLPIVDPAQSEDKVRRGLCALPEPSPGDLFLDLEGDPFGRPPANTGSPQSADSGQGTREYLFGLGRRGNDGSFEYLARWSFTDVEERRAFEEVVDEVSATLAQHPTAHIYHYGHYEPSAFKRLMGRHASRETRIDAFLRAGRFVDLLAVVREALRAGVEHYSIKSMEAFYGFAREIDLEFAGDQRRLVEVALEMGEVSSITDEIRAAVMGYNEDDCRSTLALREWLEKLRAGEIEKGVEIPRPPMKPGEAAEHLTEKELAVAALRTMLLDGVPTDQSAQTVEQHGRYVLAYLLDWHRREDKAGWWEYFRLSALSDYDLMEEPAAVAGLVFAESAGMVKKSTVQRFRYPEQEIEIRRGHELKLRDDKQWGRVVDVDRANRTIDVLVGPSKVDWRPTSAFAHKWINPEALEQSIFAVGEGVAGGVADILALELLYARPPKAREVLALDQAVLAIQGPPGTGKTYTGGVMICDLVKAGKKVGVTATGHKVIRNLLDAVTKEAAARGQAVRLAHKVGTGDAEDDEGDASGIAEVDTNEDAFALLTDGATNVLGGTAWMWARPEFRKSVDVLFVDEAGQMSLANSLAVTQATNSLVLLGDPQQLEQPIKGSHPDGVAVSALQHMLGDNQTMPEERGMFLADTWRFGDALCEFTSEAFYEDKLEPKTGIGLERQCVSGGPLNGAGLWMIGVSHEGNRNASDEEVEKVTTLVERLLSDSQWTNRDGKTAQITPADILVVSPYNAQVARLSARLQAIGVEVGTVDRFQGRQAPVVIYSMATSRPEDAPRGMEFLYSLNRLNVATSRAKCAAIVVASPPLLEPECRTPRQMKLANALCRFTEMAASIDLQ